MPYAARSASHRPGWASLEDAGASIKTKSALVADVFPAAACLSSRQTFSSLRFARPVEISAPKNLLNVDRETVNAAAISGSIIPVATANSTLRRCSVVGLNGMGPGFLGTLTSLQFHKFSVLKKNPWIARLAVKHFRPRDLIGPLPTL